MDCSRCIHNYKAKYKLSTPKEWLRMLDRHPKAKNIVFKLADEELYEELYLDTFKKHDCQAGHWNYISLIDGGDYGFSITKQGVSYIRKCYGELYDTQPAEISCHFSDEREFHFAGVTSVRQV